MRKWLAETHGPGFELLRHFVVRFFDSDLVTTSGQWTNVLIAFFSLALMAFTMVAPSLAHKFQVLSKSASPDVFRHAVRADELWLITLGMSAIGLLSASRWPAMFPGKRDYLALGGLPIRASQVFLSKLLALLLIATASIATINAGPSLMFPMVSSGRWQIHPSLMARILAHGTSCVLASYFFFFGVMAIQGLLLHVLRPRWFERVSGYLQGLLVALMLVVMVMCLSIDPVAERALTRPEMARWLPPVWFLGLNQAILGDSDPLFAPLARRALAGLAIVIAAALLSYLASYHRHRNLLMEGTSGARSGDRKLSGRLLGWAVPNPRQQAIVVFMVKTMARSGQHRMVLMAYLGFAVALILSGMLGSRTLAGERAVIGAFVYGHIVASTFLVLGLRHVFAIPTELRANWLFQMTEGQGRTQWINAVDGLVLVAILLVLLIPLPLEVRVSGWRTVAEVILAAVTGLLIYDRIFFDWDKLPFTCSYLPGKYPGWVIFLAFLGLLTFLPAASGLLLNCLYGGLGFTITAITLTTVWSRVRLARREEWGQAKLTYDERPEPAVRSLNLGSR